MLRTKFHGNQPAGSGKEDFLRFLPYIGMRGHLGHVTSMTLTNFHFLVTGNFHTNFSSEWHSSF